MLLTAEKSECEKIRKLLCLVIKEAVASTGQLMIKDSRMCDNINWMGNW